MTEQARILDAILNVLIEATYAVNHAPPNLATEAQAYYVKALQEYDAELSRWLGGKITAVPPNGDYLVR